MGSGARKGRPKPAGSGRAPFKKGEPQPWKDNPTPMDVYRGRVPVTVKAALRDMLDAPMSEEILRFERTLAKAQNRYVDDPLAITSFLERRKLSVANSMAERRRALRVAREQSSLIGDLNPPPDSAELSSVAKALDREPGGAPAGPGGLERRPPTLRAPVPRADRAGPGRPRRPPPHRPPCGATGR